MGSSHQSERCVCELVSVAHAPGAARTLDRQFFRYVRVCHSAVRGCLRNVRYRGQLPVCLGQDPVARAKMATKRAKRERVRRRMGKTRECFPFDQDQNQPMLAAVPCATGLRHGSLRAATGFDAGDKEVMSEPEKQALRLRARFWPWLKGAIATEVPPDLAACEWECRKPQCLHGDWVTCERRLAASEREKAAVAAPG